MDRIIATVNAQYGTVLGYEETSGDACVHVRCCIGHEYITTAVALEDGCTICNCLYKLRARDKKTKPVTKLYVSGETHALFRCKYGHTFGATPSTIKCPLCVLMNKLEARHIHVDMDSIYIDRDSLLRFRCEKACGDGACNKEFIASERILFANNSGCFDCAKHHVWNVRYGVTNLVRLFEMMYTCKFNNVPAASYIRFTGFNAALGVAFIHTADLQFSAKHNHSIDIARVKTYCADNNITLYIVPGRISSSFDVIKFIVERSVAAGIRPWSRLITSDEKNIDGPEAHESSPEAVRDHVISALRHVFRENTRLGTLYPQLARI